MAFDAKPGELRRAITSATVGGGGGFGEGRAAPARSSSARGALSSSSAAASSSAPAVGYQTGGGGAWASACAKLSGELQRGGAQVAVLRKCTESVGGARDSEDLRGRLAGALASSGDGVRAITGLLKGELAVALAADEGSLSQKERAERRMQQQRFEKDAAALGAAYKDAAAAANDKLRKHAAPAGGGGGGGGGAGRRGKGGGGKNTKAEEDAHLLMQQVDFEESLVGEREDAIAEIASEMAKVNETFRDIATLVEEQGKDIEVVENNTAEAQSNAQEGVKELETAEKYQKGYRKWILIMALILVVAASGITAWQVIEAKNNKK